MNNENFSAVIGAAAVITAAMIGGIVSYRISKNEDRTKLKILHELDIMELIIKPLHNNILYTQIDRKNFSQVVKNIEWLKNLFDEYYTWLPWTLINKMDRLIEIVEIYKKNPIDKNYQIYDYIIKHFKNIYEGLWRYEKQLRFDIGAPKDGLYNNIKYTLGMPVYYIVFLGIVLVCWVIIIFIALENNHIGEAVMSLTIPIAGLLITGVVKRWYDKCRRKKYAKSTMKANEKSTNKDYNNQCQNHKLDK